MDEYYCHASPVFKPSNYVTENPNPSPNFNVEFEYTNMYVLNARKFRTDCITSYHKFLNISYDTIMQETTIVSWLLDMDDVPRDAFRLVVAKVLECACNMNRYDRFNQSVLSMRVVLEVPRANEDEADEDEDEDYDIENDDFEEVVEASFDNDEDNNGLMAADKSSIEELEIVRVEEGHVERCSICFEDFNVGVRMPCLHMFHSNCIHSWLRIGSCCPLCRFQMPTNDKSE